MLNAAAADAFINVPITELHGEYLVVRPSAVQGIQVEPSSAPWMTTLSDLGLLWGVTVFSGSLAQVLARFTGLPGWCCCWLWGF